MRIKSKRGAKMEQKETKKRLAVVEVQIHLYSQKVRLAGYAVKAARDEASKQLTAKLDANIKLSAAYKEYNILRKGV